MASSQHNLLSRVRVRDGGAVVDPRDAVPLRVPLGDVLHADLKLQGRSHAVPDERLVVLRAVAVLVEVDEAGGHDQARGVDRLGALECFLADQCDLAVLYGEGPDGVESGFRVHHSPVPDDEIVLDSEAGIGRPAPGQHRRQQEDCLAHHAIITLCSL